MLTLQECIDLSGLEVEEIEAIAQHERILEWLGQLPFVDSKRIGFYGLSYGGNGWVWASDQDRAGGFGIFAIAAPQNMTKVEAAVRQELALAAEKGFTADEIADARKGMLEAVVQQRSQDRYLADRWADQRFVGRDFGWDKAYEAKLAALTPAQVSAAFKKVVDPARLAVFIAADKKKAGTP